jgi:carbon monoxide dehydrogenase subunit G
MSKTDRVNLTPTESEAWDQLSEPETMQEFEIPGVTKVQQMEEQMAYMQIENKNMSDRVAQIEMHMMEVLQHLRGLSVKAEP